MHSKLIPNLRWIHIFVILSLLIISINGISAETIDSTQVRKTARIKKTLGQKILAVPQFIIDAPIKILGATTKFSIKQVSTGMQKLSLFQKRPYGIWHFYPILNYGSNPGFEGGISCTGRNMLSENDKMKASISYSTHRYQNFNAYYDTPNFFKNNHGITYKLYYKKFPRESFYGLGENSKEEDEVAFTLEDTYLQIGSKWSLNPEASFSITGSYRISNIYNGDEPNLEGNLDSIKVILNLNSQEVRSSRIWSIQSAFTHDWRNSHGQPSQGGIEIISFSYNKGINRTDDLKYTTSKIDLRHYFNIYKKRILALRVMAQSLDTQPDSTEIPFYLRSSLGGKKNLRGYRTRRFTDNDIALVALEYRYPIWDIVDAFIFIDEGRVFNDIYDDFNLRNWRYSVGSGIRIWNKKQTLFNILFASGDEGIRFYLQFSDTF